MTFKNRPTCFRCGGHYRKSYGGETILIPRPDGQIFAVTFHLPCLERWNAFATTKAFSDVWLKKRSIIFRKQGLLHLEATA